MENALMARATSLTAAAGLCGIALLAALSIQFTYVDRGIPEGLGPVIIVDPPNLPEPDTEPKPQNPRQPSQPSSPFADAAPIETSAIGDTLTDLLPELPTATETAPLQILHPTWIERPANLQRYYPSRALRRDVTGQVRLECVVRASGWLDGCAVLSETPAGWGFGEAAVRIAREHRMSPAMRNGIEVEARYRMTVPFTVE